MKEKLSEKIDRFMNRLLAVPPTMEELLLSFPHKQGCKGREPLKIVEKEETVYVGKLGTFDMSPSFIDVTRKYLECGKCGVSKRFIEMR